MGNVLARLCDWEEVGVAWSDRWEKGVVDGSGER